MIFLDPGSLDRCRPIANHGVGSSDPGRSAMFCRLCWPRETVSLPMIARSRRTNYTTRRARGKSLILVAPRPRAMDGVSWATVPRPGAISRAAQTNYTMARARGKSLIFAHPGLTVSLPLWLDPWMLVEG